MGKYPKQCYHLRKYFGLKFNNDDNHWAALTTDASLRAVQGLLYLVASFQSMIQMIH